MAPGTGERVAMSASTATVSSDIAVPVRRSARRRAAAPSATSAGPAAASRMICGEVSWRSYQVGKRCATHRDGPGWKISPPRVAS